MGIRLRAAKFPASHRSVRTNGGQTATARRILVAGIVCGAIAGASFLLPRRAAEPMPGPTGANAPIRTSSAGAGRVLIDGRVNPEAISDASAAAILLPMIAPSPENTAAREKHRRAMLAEAGFNSHDAKIVEQVLAPLRGQVEEKRRLATAAKEMAEMEPTAANLAMLQQAFADLKAPATMALAQLRRELSSDGIVRLRVQLERIKANTKILDSVTPAKKGVDDANNR